MDTKQESDKSTRILFYFFIAQVIIGMIAVVGYMIYSFIFG